MNRLRIVLTALGLFTGAVLGAVVGFGAPIPSVPSNPTFSEPSQIIGTLNALIQTLNGQPSAIQATPGVVGIGSYGTASNVQGSGTNTLNTQNGRLTYLGMSSITQNGVTSVTLVDSLLSINSACFAQIVSGGAASSNAFVSQVSPTATGLTFVITNNSATATGTLGPAAGMTLAFECVN